MSGRICSIDGCNDDHLARGWCSKHYARWRTTGSLELREPRQPSTQCSVGGCDSPPRSKFADHCEKHYYRVRRTGTTDDPPPPITAQECSVADCGRDAERIQTEMCRKHHLRVKANGDPHHVRVGKHHPNWTGEDASYDAAHQRVHQARGSATNHPCASCGTDASHWAYDRTDPDERSGGKGPYSVNLDHFRPMCVSCHKLFDLRCIDGSIDPFEYWAEKAAA